MELYSMAWESSAKGSDAALRPACMHTDEYSPKYKEWRSKQNSEILSRGKSPIHDFEEEEKYIQRMIKTVLRSHICYREVDAYADCIVKHNLASDRDLTTKGLVDVNQRLAKEKCPREVSKYLACTEAKTNHETIVAAAATHQRCDDKRRTYLVCLQKNAKSAQLQERHCFHSEYFPLLRCGLNAMFDEYWKGVTGYTVANEMHHYEIDNDSKAKRGVAELRQKLEMESHVPVQ